MRECYEKTEFGGERDQIEKRDPHLNNKISKKKKKKRKKENNYTEI